jgi:quercetin dioxygenase-like cupin family protein
MKVKSNEKINPENYVEGVKKMKLINDRDGAQNFAMRLFEVDKNAPFPPSHSHPWEHEIYILEGKGVVIGEEGEKPFMAGDAIFIPPNEIHQIKQQDALRFICVVPLSGD